MADICNVDLQLPIAIRQRSNQHRVIEVARRLAIDRDDLQPAKISSLPQFLRVQGVHSLCSRSRSFRQYIRRKYMRQMVLANDDLDIHAKRIRAGPSTSITRPLAWSSCCRKIRNRVDIDRPTPQAGLLWIQSPSDQWACCACASSPSTRCGVSFGVDGTSAPSGIRIAPPPGEPVIRSSSGVM